MRGNVQQRLTGLQGGSYKCLSLFPLAFPRHEATALTYREWVGFVLGRDMLGESIQAFVQFQRRGIKACGVVVDGAPADGSSDWFQIRSLDGGLCWLPQANVRLCSGDGRCSCEALALEGARVAGASGACAVPLGNTGTTVAGNA